VLTVEVIHGQAGRLSYGWGRLSRLGIFSYKRSSFQSLLLMRKVNQISLLLQFSLIGKQTFSG
ncbi:MAG: hypothetical protein C0394_05445, partial [Syntrophus sp. (in: bacteria)]|nr:hypothetical protein [Syntrophus sp. (in: bacteria)]